MRIGVLGSAFNPPHLGHLVLAEEASFVLGLDRVLLMPTGRAPHKEIVEDPGAELRCEMARSAASVADDLQVSELELRREGPSYTFETLEALHHEMPQAELYWLMGADAAMGLGGWKRPERIVELAALGIATREGVKGEELDRSLEKIGCGPERTETIEMPVIGVSSTMIRARVRSGRPIRHLVPEPVAELIGERGLYGG